jgi:branched-chain amino acid transport system substrate-binding protein
VSVDDLSTQFDADTDAAKSGLNLRSPFRVGQLQDWGMGVQVIQDQFDATAMAFEEAYAIGILDRPVEVITRAVEGLPYHSFRRARVAYQELVDEGCLVVLGPHTSEQLAAMTKDPQRVEVPTITIAVTTEWHGQYCFSLQNGSFGDEVSLMVAHLVDRGARTVAVLHEENLIGEDYWHYMREHCRDQGITIVGDQTLGMFFEAADARRVLIALRDLGTDSIAYVGNGFAARHVLAAMSELVAEGWDPIRVTGSIFMAATPGLGYGIEPADFEGWAGIEQWHEENSVFAAMLDRFEARFGRRADHCFTALGYDLGAVTARAIAGARPVCPERIQHALEQIRGLRATIGGPGTLITFAPYAHRGYNGEYILMRRYVDGKNIRA